jgi:hypothetical protein
MVEAADGPDENQTMSQAKYAPSAGGRVGPKEEREGRLIREVEHVEMSQGEAEGVLPLRVQSFWSHSLSISSGRERRGCNLGERSEAERMESM